MHDGLRRMYGEGERVYYYLTLMNKKLQQPAMPEGAEEGIKRGMYLLEDNGSTQVQLLGSGVILREVQKASQILKDEFNITSNVPSMTSFNELTRDGMVCDDCNRLHPMEEEKVPWVTEQLAPHEGIVVAATIICATILEQIRAWLPDNRPYTTLGTDGYGRSDTRENLRSFFNVDAAHIVVATLKRLADEGEVEMRLVKARFQA